MDIIQIEYFLAVARTENMTAAATSLHVAQSSVSRCISRLEDYLGVPLFDRGGHGIALNEYGRAFYPRAEAIMRELTDGAQQLKEMRDQNMGRIAISTCATRQINQLMVRHMEEYPDVLFRQHRISDLDEIRGMLDRGVLDFALTFTPLSEHDYNWTPLIRERYFVLVSQEHPLAAKSSASVLNLKNERILLNDSDSPDFIEEQFQKYGVTPALSFIGNEFDVLGPMVERQVGITLISTLALYDLKLGLPLENLSRIRILPLEENLSRTLGILSRKHHYTSQTAKAFYKALVGYFKELDHEMNHTP